jgi:uncharacterized damage-inducible protein DinB
MGGAAQGDAAAREVIVGEDFATLYRTELETQFRKLKQLAERAIAQLPDEDLTRSLDGESNSIALLMQHMGNNLRSRFTDFLTSDGEKPDRHRDAEFEAQPGTTRASLFEIWEDGWGRLFAALSTLSDDDLVRTVFIRGEPHSVLKALQRQLTHHAYHAGQIILLARSYAGPRWTSLSVPKGKSDEFNAKMRARYAGNA